MTDKTVVKGAQNGKNGKHTNKSLGPVSDLEKHVSPDWWRHIFNAIYLKTDADVVDDHNITREEVDIFSDTLHLTSHDYILDLCCGQGRHTLELARRGYKVVGMDRSRYLIQRARATAKKEGLNTKFREGDVRNLPYPANTFEVVMILGNSFGYFETTQDDLQVLREVFRVLKPEGRLLIDVTDGDYIRENFQARSWEWLDKKLFVCRERSLSSDEQRLISREVVTDVSKGVIADQFYAERLYNKTFLADLMKKVGFSQVMLEREIQPNSARNQDLGMMAQRLIITAQVDKPWVAPPKATKTTTKNVVVVMGDPDKPDLVKPDTVFDADDFYTIDQLKSALASLPDYRFTYLTNHDTLLPDLKRLQPECDLVFNLCDEGYNNDPRQELHVPALLEMLNLPYTGSAPQCLAYCYDKSLVRGIAREIDVPVPEAYTIVSLDRVFEQPPTFPAMVKPNFGDSSFGITQRSVVHSLEALTEVIGDIRARFGYDKPILVEEFLSGQDLSVGIIGNPTVGYRVLPITEEDYAAVPEDLPRICGYEAKWDPASPYWQIKSVPANLPADTEKMIVEWCLRLFERLDCRDYCRFDWRLDASGYPKLLEVNPNPGWCWDGHLAKMANFDGMSYSDMLNAILQAADQRVSLAKMRMNSKTMAY
jgi:D-alanine-D-alanine ligase